MQNAIKLENISNLITPPSSYQCRHKVSAFCYAWPTQSHTSMEAGHYEPEIPTAGHYEITASHYEITACHYEFKN
jgi:hypothetical protein